MPNRIEFTSSIERQCKSLTPLLEGLFAQISAGFCDFLPPMAPPKRLLASDSSPHTLTTLICCEQETFIGSTKSRRFPLTDLCNGCNVEIRSAAKNRKTHKNDAWTSLRLLSPFAGIAGRHTPTLRPDRRTTRFRLTNSYSRRKLLKEFVDGIPRTLLHRRRS